ncbi:MAG: hypothetical protein K6E40_11555 [Desulfovibrio sp.]|nr:hypothetical protein [Desulfovibrio sp.]
MKRVLPALLARTVLAGALLAGSCLALFSQPALAEVKVYGPELQRFSLDVPDSWREEPQDAGIRLVSPDGRAVVAAAVAPSEGKSAESLVRKIAGNLSGTGVKRLDESTFAFTVTSENTPVRCLLRAGDEFFLVETMAGDPAIAEPVFQSLKLEGR